MSLEDIKDFKIKEEIRKVEKNYPLIYILVNETKNIFDKTERLIK